MEKHDLEKLLEGAREDIHQRLLADGGVNQLAATFYLFGPEDYALVHCPWADPQEKRAMVKEVRRQARRIKAAAALFMTEAWAVTRPKDYFKGPLGDPPSQQPDRQEVLLFAATNGEITLVRSWSMVRDAQGRLVDLVERERTEDHGFSSPLLEGIIPPPPRATVH